MPLVLDADGINALAAHKDVLRESACPIVLTPHGGEFLRLGGDPLHRDPVSEAMRVSVETGCVVLLKGCRTVITDGLNVYRNATGNPGLATGGSWLCDEPYAVLRRLALNARGRGRGLTRVLFDLAAERSREQGITYLRLNTGLQNSRMQHILEKNGFTRRGIIVFKGSQKYAYDKRI